jgi:hypothetical protein
MFAYTGVQAALASIEYLIAPATQSHKVHGQDRRGGGQ